MAEWEMTELAVARQTLEKAFNALGENCDTRSLAARKIIESLHREIGKALEK